MLCFSICCLHNNVKSQLDSTILTFVQQMPVFPGGVDSMYSFISRNILVEVKFADGEMISSSNFDSEPFNYVEQMPSFPGGPDSMYRFIWTHPVNFTLPIKFSLQ